MPMPMRQAAAVAASALPSRLTLAPVLLLAALLLLGGCEQAAAPDASPDAAPVPLAARDSAPPATPATVKPASGQQLVQIIDGQGFGAPVTAATVQIPAGWRTEGGVQWDRSSPCVANQLRIGWLASAPDGSQAFEIMRGFSWQVQGRHIGMNPCPVLPFATTRDFLLAVVQQRRNGARVLGYQPRPDLAAQAEAQSVPDPRVRRQQDAGELRIAYAMGGDEVQERLVAAVAFTEVQGSVMGGTGMVFAHRLRGGAPDPTLGDRIAASVKAQAQWLAMVKEATDRSQQQFADGQRQQIDRWHAGEMARINAQGAADRAAIRAQTSRDVARIQNDTYNNTQASNERMHRRNLEGVGEYNTYRDSSGNTVRSSIHGGSRVLQMPDGTVTSTDNPYFNPPGSVELKRVP